MSKWTDDNGATFYGGVCRQGGRAATELELAAIALVDAKGAKLRALSKVLSDEIAWGLVWQEVIYQIDSVSQGRIGNRAQVARDCIANVRTWLPIYCGWIAADNTREVEFSPEGFLDFAYAAHDYFTEVTLYANSLKQQIEQAGTLGAVAAIDVNAGWPGGE